jgi:hypothetical protein
MNRHRYLRAYMAGVVLPTMFLLVAMVAFTMIRYVYNVPIPIERVIVFPMALSRISGVFGTCSTCGLGNTATSPSVCTVLFSWC